MVRRNRYLIPKTPPRALLLLRKNDFARENEWGLVHGLAMLVIDGYLANDSHPEPDENGGAVERGPDRAVGWLHGDREREGRREPTQYLS